MVFVRQLLQPMRNKARRFFNIAGNYPQSPRDRRIAERHELHTFQLPFTERPD